jgi:adenosylhomocysteine nucleosidase
MDKSTRVIVLISANVEWRAVLEIARPAVVNESLYGGWFTTRQEVSGSTLPLIFFHGGWGKIAAGASTQYAIDRWKPDLLVNLGTCGGFAGQVERGTVLLVERTIVYDIIEQMGDFDEHIAHYTTDLDLSWLKEPYPHPVRRSLLVSGDRDLLVEDIPMLVEKYGAVAGDWESGAIAFVAARNGVPCLILRGVTDLVGSQGGEAYGNISLFEVATRRLLEGLIQALPAWLAQADLYL